MHLFLDGPDSCEEFRREFLGLGLTQKGGKFGYPFRERGEENPQGPAILKVERASWIFSLGIPSP